MKHENRLKALLVIVFSMGYAAAKPASAEAQIRLDINFHPALGVSSEPDAALSIRLKRDAFADLSDWAAKSSDYADGFAFEFRRHCTIPHEADGVRSVLCTTRSFRGGANGETFYDTILWDMRKDQEIGLSDLIEADGLPALAEALYYRAEQLSPDGYLLDAGALADPEMLEQRAFVVQAGSLEFMFNTREIAPVVLGAPIIAVPTAPYGAYLTPLGRRALGDDALSTAE
jgi:hypothetical protein